MSSSGTELMQLVVFQMSLLSDHSMLLWFHVLHFSVFICSLSGHWWQNIHLFSAAAHPRQAQPFVYDSPSLSSTQLRYLQVDLGWSVTPARQMGSWQWSVKNWDIRKWVDLHIITRSLQAALLTVVYFPIQLIDICWVWPGSPKETVPCSQPCLPQQPRNLLVNFNTVWKKARGLKVVRLFHLYWKLKAWQRKVTSLLTQWEKKKGVWWELAGQSVCEYNWVTRKEGVTHEPEHILLLTWQ